MDVFCYIMIIISAYMVLYVSYDKQLKLRMKSIYRGLYIGLWGFGTVIWTINFIANG